VKINNRTGLIDKLISNNSQFTNKGCFLPIVIDDINSSWGKGVRGTEFSYDERVGQFSLMSKSKNKTFSANLKKKIESVRIIEDGEVRTIV